jgi:hypothetical protein
VRGLQGEKETSGGHKITNSNLWKKEAVMGLHLLEAKLTNNAGDIRKIQIKVLTRLLPSGDDAVPYERVSLPREFQMAITS